MSCLLKKYHHRSSSPFLFSFWLWGVPLQWTNPSVGAVKEPPCWCLPWLPPQGPKAGLWMCCQQCIFVFSLSQVKRHKVVSLFSGVLGLELGLGGCGAQSWSWWVWCSILVSLQRCCFLQILVAKVYRTLGFCPALRLWHLLDFQCCQQPN